MLPVPEKPAKKPRQYTAVSVKKSTYQKLKTICNQENASMARVIAGLLKYYENNTQSVVPKD